MKKLKKSAKENKRNNDSKWKEMERTLKKLSTLVENLSITWLTEPRQHRQATQHLPPQLHLHPSPTVFRTLRHTQLLPAHTKLILAILVCPLLDLQVLLASIWVLKEENLRSRGLYCLMEALAILMEKESPP